MGDSRRHRLGRGRRNEGEAETGCAGNGKDWARQEPTVGEKTASRLGPGHISLLNMALGTDRTVLSVTAREALLHVGKEEARLIKEVADHRRWR